MVNVTNWLLFQSAVDAGPPGSGGLPKNLDDLDPQGLGLGQPWVNPLAALTFGGQQASSGPIGLATAVGTKTNILRISQPSIAGQIPLEFRLLGVEVEVRGRWEGGTDGTRTVPVSSVVGSALRTSIGSCSLPVSPSVGVCIKGGPIDRMNFSEADVANAGFGFQLFGSSTTFNFQGNTLFIDSLRVRLHWTDPLPSRRLRSRTRAALTRNVAI
ncbi:MAG: hypothetical protein RLN60_01345 [Phycisphaerales bacterium]